MKTVEDHKFIPAPEYLDEKFFVSALKEGLRAYDVKIDTIKYSLGTSPGNNYCSDIYRVVIDGDVYLDTDIEWEPLKISLIVKVLTLKAETQFLEQTNVFIKEKVTYYDVLPHLEILSDGEQFAAKCFYATDNPIQVIVFEDLKSDGFKVFNQYDQLDWMHAALLIKQLAKFHATSMVLLDKKPALKKRFQKSICSKELISADNVYSITSRNCLKLMISACSTFPNFEKITEKLRKYLDNYQEITIRTTQPTPNNRYKVLNHGDVWIQNVMFKYDDATNELSKMKFVDFQFTYYGSPGLDLNMLLSTSIQLDVVQHKRDDLIDLYYETFEESLRSLNYQNIPTKDDLLYEVRAHELFGFFSSFSFLPLQFFPKLLSQSDSSALKDSIDSVDETSTYIENIYKILSMVYQSECVKEHLKYCLRRFDDLGVLDEF